MRRLNRARAAGLARLCLAAATLLLATALIVQCVLIYSAGNSPENRTGAGVYIHDIYSPAIVAERLMQIGWILCLWLAAWALALLCRALCPAPRRAAPSLSAQSRLELLALRVLPNAGMLRERRQRRIAAAACAAVCAVCAAMICQYLFAPEHFASRELESVMGALMLHTAPWVALAFAALTALAQLRHRSMLREIEAAKSASPRMPEPRGEPTRGIVRAGRVALLICAVLLIALGIANGGMYDVLVKAINICTECIGLG